MKEKDGAKGVFPGAAAVADYSSHFLLSFSPFSPRADAWEKGATLDNQANFGTKFA